MIFFLRWSFGSKRTAQDHEEASRHVTIWNGGLGNGVGFRGITGRACAESGRGA